MNFFKIFFVAAFLQSCTSLYSQNTHLKDSVFSIKEIVIHSNRLQQFSSANHQQQIDTTLKKVFTSGNITELLSISTQGAFNSYGPGGLATCSMRGVNSNQTAIVWNGFNLQSPNSGQQDLSLIPSAFIDDISVQYGGNSALYGSGAIGGIVNLSTNPEDVQGLKIKTRLTGGSFDYRYGSLNIEHGYRKIFSSVRLFKDACDNDFDYVSVENKKAKQQNAAYNQQGILVSERVLINDKNQILCNYWLTDNYNEDPPTMLNTLSLANEKKSSQRGTFEWKYSSKRYSLNFRSGIFDDRLSYNDSILKIKSNSNTRIFINEMEHVWAFKKHIIAAALNRTDENGTSENFGTDKKRIKYALGTNYKLFLNRLSVYASARAEIVGDKSSPLTYSIGSAYQVKPNIVLKANIAKSYRLPTFNDLYWGAWGNPDLKPESGITAECGIEAVNHFKAFSMESNLTFFNNNIRDMILWVPAGNIWTPRNISKVWSRGLEWSEKLNYKIQKFNITLGANYTYTVSTNNRKDDVNYNNQLIYVPIYKGNLFTVLSFKNISALYSHQYIGNRYYTEDNTKTVEAYNLACFQVSYKSGFSRKLSAKYFLKIDNLWNQSYQAVAWYAMPLRQFQLGIEINFNNLKSKISN